MSETPDNPHEDQEAVLAETPSEEDMPHSQSRYTAVSVESNYQLHKQGPFTPTKPSPPKPVLSRDATHTPRTRGSFGIMVVGIGGANGTTMLAGILANRFNIQWRGARGEEMTPNYYGCITQLNQRGKYGGVGYKDKVKGLADASMAAVGGWDIRPSKLGDALLDAHILDYDLVRQVQPEMNKVKVFRGAYDPRFIGTSQHATATHILTKDDAPNDAQVLKCLRADIRYFKWRNGVVGHTTVIWSASVEPNSDLVTQYATAADLLNAIEMTHEERGGPLPPSILYATAALLEGCSFINGGSQNTLSCPGLEDLAKLQLGVYVLGTDFKAGQTKFKTAAVEYIRTMGLKPKVIASSNHLGNNDMRNLASAKTASTAKLRVKHDIFAAWEEDELDHKVSIMFTEFINDEKRDFVEYTSLGFLGQTHTMVTYTRASDSILCVPLMLDGAVWCDYFSGRSWPYDKVAKALAYLFKVPEGAAKGVDPGFFRQMEALDVQVLAAHHTRDSVGQSAKKRVRIRPEEMVSEWAIPRNARIMCGGLACLDMQLNRATGGHGGESIERFEGEISMGGGSVAMACKTLARLCHGAPLDDGYMEVTPPVVSSVVPLCKLGDDNTGRSLISLLEECGSSSRNIDTKVVRMAMENDPKARTALSVLPIYQDGRRGCFFDAASNDTFTSQEMISYIRSLSPEAAEENVPPFGAFIFGYPHLLPQLQGENLAKVIIEARNAMIDGGIVAIDLNGVPRQCHEASGERDEASIKLDPVLGPSLKHIDILHMNEEELQLLSGCILTGKDDADEAAIGSVARKFLACGVAVILVTRGKKGCFVACNNSVRFERSPALPSSWADCALFVQAAELPKDARINSNGAGDSFTAGFLVASLLRHTGQHVQDKSIVETTCSREMSFGNDEPIPPRKISPFDLYAHDNFLVIKARGHVEEDQIMLRCKEMWAEETEDVMRLYERRAVEENEEEAIKAASQLGMSNELSPAKSYDSSEDADPSMFMTNRSLDLESAAKFAGLVASHHINAGTRDLSHLDMASLLHQAMVFQSDLTEI